MIDYSEILCQSIDNIAKKRANEIQLNLNSIREYTIIDNKDSSNGSYEVINNNTTTTAYVLDGNTVKYNIGDVVYVLLLSNDISKNKFILSKKRY